MATSKIKLDGRNVVYINEVHGEVSIVINSFYQILTSAIGISDKVILNHWSDYISLLRTRECIIRPLPFLDLKDYTPYYVPSKITTPSGDVATCLDDLFEVSDRIFIYGGAGVGKSTFLRFSALNAINGDKGFFPLFYSATNLRHFDFDLIQYYAAVFNSMGLVGENIVTGLLGEASTVVFVDGLDELRLEEFKFLKKKVNQLGIQYPKVKYVLSSRDPQSSSSFSGFSRFRINAMDNEGLSMIMNEHLQESDREPFMHYLLNVTNQSWDEHSNEARAQKLAKLTAIPGKAQIAVFNPAVFTKTADVINTPLLLILLVHIYMNHNTDLPRDKPEIYNLYLRDTTFYNRKLQLNITVDQLFTLVCQIAWKGLTFEHDVYFIKTELQKYIKANELPVQFTEITDLLVKDLGVFVRTSLNQLEFAHRSFQEYFAAHYLRNNFEIALSSTFSSSTFPVLEFFTRICDHKSHLYNAITQFIHHYYNKSNNFRCILDWALKKSKDYPRQDRPAIFFGYLALLYSHFCDLYLTLSYLFEQLIFLSREVDYFRDGVKDTNGKTNFNYLFTPWDNLVEYICRHEKIEPLGAEMKQRKQGNYELPCGENFLLGGQDYEVLNKFISGWLILFYSSRGNHGKTEWCNILLNTLDFQQQGDFEGKALMRIEIPLSLTDQQLVLLNLVLRFQINHRRLNVHEVTDPSQLDSLLMQAEEIIDLEKTINSEYLDSKSIRQDSLEKNELSDIWKSIEGGRLTFLFMVEQLRFLVSDLSTDQSLLRQQINWNESGSPNASLPIEVDLASWAAARAFQLEDLRFAKFLYKASIDNDPNYIIGYIQLSSIYELLGWPEKAIHSLELALNRNLSNEDYALVHFRILRAKFYANRSKKEIKELLFKLGGQKLSQEQLDFVNHIHKKLHINLR